jgi:ribonuclease P/MRP protein subunit POP1
VGGLRERQTQSFESGVPYFPRDYPFCKAAEEEEEQRAQEEKERWERKPPAKRCNWEKVGTRSPWKPDWTIVLGIQDVEGDGEFVTTQRSTNHPKKIHPWLLQGPDISQILSNASKLLSPSLGLHDEINNIRLKRDQERLDSAITADDLWRGALVRVRLKMCNRGSPSNLAIIYTITDAEARKWIVALGKQGDTEENASQVEVRRGAISCLMTCSWFFIQLSEISPSQDSIIGYITSGGFSLSRGEGFSIGAIPVARLFELQNQAQKYVVEPVPLHLMTEPSTGSKVNHF